MSESRKRRRSQSVKRTTSESDTHVLPTEAPSSLPPAPAPAPLPAPLEAIPPSDSPADGPHTSSSSSSTHDTPHPRESPSSSAAPAPLPTYASFAAACGLDVRLSKSIARCGWIHPTPVQVASLPPLLSGRDVLLKSRTGSGKTGAFATALLQRLMQLKASGTGSGSGVQGVILVPTRELVEQTVRVVRELNHYGGDVLTVTGVTNGPLSTATDVLVCTPTRCAALLKGSGSLLAHVAVVVVDEADLTLAHGHSRDLNVILAALPRDTVQVALVSATLSQALDELQRLALRAPVTVDLTDVSGSGTQGVLTQLYVRVGASDKYLLLYALIKLKLVPGKALIFVNDAAAAFKTKLFLERFSVRACVCNAELPVNSRSHMLKAFNAGVYDYLIATDASLSHGLDVEDTAQNGEGDAATAAPAPSRRKRARREKGAIVAAGDEDTDAFEPSRGIDFRDVHTVINLDFPPSASVYTHRIGRTARANMSGVALSMIPPVGVAPAQDAVLDALHASQPRDDAGAVVPSPLPFNLRECEPFRYRVDDVLRSITRSSIKEARLSELRSELLTSHTLDAHWEDHPREAELLKRVRHDIHLAPHAIKPHLKDVPDYLMPPSLVAALSAAGADVHASAAPRKHKKSRAPRSAPTMSTVPSHKERTTAAASDVYKPQRQTKDPLKNLARSRR